MKELQAVMFDIGIGTPVTQEAAGKEYYSQLAAQFAQFVQAALDRCGGIMTLIDAYCLYNRARGTDLISPKDIYIAASMCPKMGLPFQLRQLKSEVWIFESSEDVLELNSEFQPEDADRPHSQRSPKERWHVG